MSYKKYLEIDSTYRNREAYPYSSDFVIPFSYISRELTNVIPADPVVFANPYVQLRSRYTDDKVTYTIFNLSEGFSSVELSSKPSTIDNYYVNQTAIFFFNRGSAFKFMGKIIKSYVEDPDYGNISTLYVEGLPSEFNFNMDSVFICKTQPFFFSRTPGGSDFPNTNQLIFKNNISISPAVATVDQAYKGSYMKFFFYEASQSFKNFPDKMKIIDYNGTTNIATFIPSLPQIFTNIFIPQTYTIGQLDRDNEQNLLYSGNLQQNINGIEKYYISVETISIPNQNLICGYGGVLSDYPYIYIQLYNDSARKYEQILHSNNPNTVLATFKLKIDNYQGVTKFYTLTDSCDMKQIVNFKVNENIRFRVTLPNGESLKFFFEDTSIAVIDLKYIEGIIPYPLPLDTFQKSDTKTPIFPTPLLQITAIFKLEPIPAEIQTQWTSTKLLTLQETVPTQSSSTLINGIPAGYRRTKYIYNN